MRIIFFDLPMNYILRSPRFRVASATSSYPDRHTFVSRPPRFNVAHTAK